MVTDARMWETIVHKPSVTQFACVQKKFRSSQNICGQLHIYEEIEE